MLGRQTSDLRGILNLLNSLETPEEIKAAAKATIEAFEEAEGQVEKATIVTLDAMLAMRIVRKKTDKVDAKIEEAQIRIKETFTPVKKAIAQIKALREKIESTIEGSDKRKELLDGLLKHETGFQNKASSISQLIENLVIEEPTPSTTGIHADRIVKDRDTADRGPEGRAM